MPTPCPGPLIWYDAGIGAILYCVTCGYMIVSGSLFDEAHARADILREGLAA